MLANGVAEREPVFGTWQVELSGEPEQAGGFLSASRVNLVADGSAADDGDPGLDGPAAPSGSGER